MPGSSTRLISMISCGSLSASPNMSKPQTRLAMVAGAFTFTFLPGVGCWFVLFIIIVVILIVLYPCRTNDICKNAGGCYFCAGSRTLDHQRLLGITAGVEQHHIILSIQVIKIVLRVDM